MTSKKIGILLSNIGTPDAPTPQAVRRYLCEFLSDTRVIEIPKVLWQPFLQLILLQTRPKNSAKLYEKIWTENGSPLLYNSLQIAKHLQQVLNAKFENECLVRVGMRYGNPSIQSALLDLRANDVEHLLIFPMYPQYSATTTASTFDAVAKTFKSWRHLPEVSMLNEYALDANYIHAVCESIRHYWREHSQKYLLFSFHGIPQRNIDAGDPYEKLCRATARLIAEELQLSADDWSLAFQSRLGPSQWLKPYTNEILAMLPLQGIQEIQVVCPGFPADCLETLEEIAIRGEEEFLAGGGKSFAYIPALNDSPLHIAALTEIISARLS